jgi:PDZ domain-containing protein
MIKKFFKEVFEIIKEDKKFFTIWAILILLSIPFPFYIEKTGGLINITSRVGDTNSSGSLNMAYVSSVPATIPNLIIAKLNSNWDIYTSEEENGTSSKEETEFSDKLALNSSIKHATIAAYKEANLEYKKENNKIYVTYVYELADTDLHVKDQIIKIDDTLITDNTDISKYIDSQDVGKEITITVISNNKEIERKATIKELEGRKLIGIAVDEDFDLKVENEITIDFKSSESGPSGGLMMALAIYSKVTNTDLTKGLKIAGTGTIDDDGNVGEIGGVKYKLAGAVKEKADIFLVPNDTNYEEALEEQKKHNYNIKIVGISTLKEAIEYLKS